MPKCPHDAARSAVGHHEIAARQHLVLGDESFDPDVLRLRPERRGIDVLPNGDHDVDRHPTEPVEDPDQQLGHREDGAERAVDRRTRQFVMRRNGGSGAERERLWWQAGIGAPETRGEWREHEVAVEHPEIRVGRQPVLVAERLQRLGDDALAQKSSRREHEHADAWEPEPLGRDCSAEVDFVADDDVGSPRAGNLDDRGSVPPGALTSEVLAEIAILLLWIDPDQGRGLGRKAMPIAGRRRQGGSTWQSVARGQGSVETDYLNGEIVRIGRLYGVATPVNENIQARMRAAIRSHAL